MSYQEQIADAIVTVLGALSGAPALVEYRKQDALHPGDSNEAVIVSAGYQRMTGRAFEGTVYKDYGFQVSVYRTFLGDLTADVDTNPAYVQLAKQALDLPALSGVPVVFDVELVQDAAWENNQFPTGSEVSRFGVLVRTAEPQNG